MSFTTLYYSPTDLPSSPPRISGVEREYDVGEIVRGNCSTRSKPAAALSWYINDVKVLATMNYFQ